MLKLPEPKLLQTDADFAAIAQRNASTLRPILDRLEGGLAVAFDEVTARHPLHRRNLPRLLTEACGETGTFDSCRGFESQRWYFIKAQDIASATLAAQKVLQRIGLLRFARIFAIEPNASLVEVWPRRSAAHTISLNGPTDSLRAGADCQPSLPQLATETKTRETPRTNPKLPFLKRLFGFLLRIAPILPLTAAGTSLDWPPNANAFGFQIRVTMKRSILLDLDYHSGGGGSSLSESQFQSKVLKGVDHLAGEINRLKQVHNDLTLKFAGVQKLAQTRGFRTEATPGRVSDACAAHLAGIVILSGIKAGKLDAKLETVARDLMGAQYRTALTSSDIPLPVAYGGEVAELVGMYGVARKWCTVLPLGSGVVKLPRLKTDPTFGLLSGSGPVTEKSPQNEWVTFTAEKFGGLVRLPSEMEEDSIVEVGQFVARYAARQLAYLEDWQCFRSTGAASGVNGTAEGLTKSVATDSKTITSTGLGSPSEFTLTHFRNLRGVPDASALRLGAYYLHPSFEALLASFNTSGNKPYNPTAQIQGTGAQPFMTGPTLDGFPIRWVDVMPVYTTNDAVSTVHVLFGDASFQYLGVRGDIRFDTSTEAGFTTDEILIRALERMTTGKMATGCMGGLITAAS